MSISLFDEISKGGYEACLMTTYSVDFPFYEDVLLSKMQSRGITHHVLLADKGMCQSTITQRPPNKAGKQYSLVLMNCSGAFHPKIIMLLGKNKGLLAVGSHNVTFSGFGKNLELTNIITFKKKHDEQYLPLFKTAFTALRTWLNDYAIEPESQVQAALSAALEDTLKLVPWLKGRGGDTTEDAALLFSSATTPSLWQQLTPLIPSKSQQVIAISPFFDKSLAFSKTLTEKSQSNLIVGLQPKEAVVSQAILSTKGIKVIDSDTINNSKDGKYIHAKAIYFADEYSPVFVNGSANLSAKAWLTQGRSANAEAVLVRSGASAVEVAKLVGITALVGGEQVKELPSKVKEQLEKTTEVASLELISIDEQDAISIAIKQHWQAPLSVYYIDEWQQKYPIEFAIIEGNIVIEHQAISSYGVISVFADQQLCSSIIIHHVLEIKRCCTTGAEREIQQAWGSLNTEHPDIKLLFNCLDKLSCFNSKPKGSDTSATALSPTTTRNEQDGKRELVVDLDAQITKNPLTGKIRASQGDIANVLDLVIYSLNSNINSTTQKQYGEDNLGRNEEDLIGSDDEDIETELDDAEQSLKLKLAELCRGKVKRLINKLAKLLKQNKDITPTEISAALVTVSILPPLDEKSTSENTKAEKTLYWLPSDSYQVLLDTLFEHIFIEKHTPLTFDKQTTNTVFSTDEAAQLISYLIWLMYKSSYALQPIPSLYFTKEQSEARNKHNARLLFAFQRYCYDDTIKQLTQNVFAQYADNNAKIWLDTLKDKIDNLLFLEEFTFCSGYRLAKSENAFNGYRLVVDNDNEYTRIASTNTDGKLNKIKTDRLILDQPVFKKY
jgi:hypothetical protein